MDDKAHEERVLRLEAWRDLNYGFYDLDENGQPVEEDNE